MKRTRATKNLCDKTVKNRGKGNIIINRWQGEVGGWQKRRWWWKGRKKVGVRKVE